MKKTSKVKIFLVIIAVIYRVDSFSQNISFSQFYATKTLYNPSFVAQERCRNVLFHTFDKNPSVDKGYTASDFMYYDYFPGMSSGFSVSASYDRQPGGVFSFTSLSLAYIYNIELGKEFSLAFNLKGDYSQFVLNGNSLVFSSSIDPVRGIVSTTNYGVNTNSALGFSSGMLFYGDNFFAGLQFDNIAMVQLGGNIVLEKKWLVTSGYSFSFSRYGPVLETYVIQKTLTWTETGIIAVFDSYWGGISLALYDKTISPVKLAFDLGLNLNKIMVGFNYSLFYSGFTGNAFEMNIKYKIKCKKNRGKAIICPAYQL